MTGADLTFYELHMLAMRADENSMIAGGILITGITGFLVMSYAVGATLSRLQCLMVTPLFLVFSILCLLQTVGYATVSDRFRPRNWSPDLPPFAVVDLQNPFAPSNITMASGPLIIFGCVYFLYNVRKTAKEEKENLGVASEHSEEATPEIEEQEVLEENETDKMDANVAKEDEVSESEKLAGEDQHGTART